MKDPTENLELHGPDWPDEYESPEIANQADGITNKFLRRLKIVIICILLIISAVLYFFSGVWLSILPLCAFALYWSIGFVYRIQSIDS